MQMYDGTKLAACRKAAGYTQKAFAEAVGTVESHVQAWEHNRRQPTATYLLRAMMLLRCTAADLLTDEQE